MKFRPPPMQPAFYGTGHLILWIVALGAILLSPILTALVVSPETRYLVMSKRVGPSDWHMNEALKETGSLDILVLGQFKDADGDRPLGPSRRCEYARRPREV